MLKVIWGFLILAASGAGVDGQAPEKKSLEPAEELRAEGLMLLEKGQLEQAAANLEKAKGVLDKDLAIRLALGDIYLNKKSYQQALNEYSAGIQLDPNSPYANLGRARALIALDDAKKALSHVKLVTEIQPQNPQAWDVLGQAYLHPQMQEYQNAEAAFRKVLELEPQSRSAGMSLAKALSYQKKAEEATLVLEKILQRDPKDLEVMVKLAETYYALLRLDLAEDLLNQALAIDPTHADAKRVLQLVNSRKSFNFWVLLIAAISFPVFYLLIRWMRKGRRIPKLPDGDNPT